MRFLRPDTATRATCWYCAFTLVLTWPLVARLAHDVPWDLGDPLLNCWILAWNISQALRVLGGDWGAASEWWHTNVFYPSRYTLGYSELLVTQSLMGLPVQAAVGNIVFTYNVVFLATFVLAGLGAYLLVRRMTGDWRAGFIAGLAFAFAPYRFHQGSHLQVMSSQWMPFVLWGLRRYFDLTGIDRSGGSATRRSAVLSLAVAALALAAQNLSCGYYMLFFAPFVPLYVVYEMWGRQRLADWRSWIALAVTGVVALLITLPFMTPYLALRGLGQQPRGIEEVGWFSADVYAYLTADASLHGWGWLQAFPHPEGSLFPGTVPVLLSVMGLWVVARTCARSTRAPLDGTASGGREFSPASSGRAARIRRSSIAVATVVGALHVIGAIVILTTGDRMFEVGPLELRLFSIVRPMVIAAIASAVVLALSPRWRRFTACVWRYPLAFAVAGALLAFWLSLGPVIRVLGDPLRDGALYAWLFEHVPGFDGLRVPARYAMIVGFFLSIAGGTAAALLRWPRTQAGFLVVCAALVLESAMMPIPRNGLSPFEGLNLPPDSVTTRPTALTQTIDALPPEAVLLELPFGEISWEIRYQYLSIFHWRRMVNGYSGDFPARYIRQRAMLEGLPEAGGDAAWATIRDSGATHVIVHGEAFGDPRTSLMREWLEARGGRFVAGVPPSYIYVLPPR